MSNFIHSVAAIFKGDEERQQRKLAEIAAEQNETERRRGIVMRAAMFADRVEAARRQLARSTAPIDAELALARERVFSLWLARSGGEPAGMSIAELGSLLAAHNAIGEHAQELKAYLHRQTVGAAEKTLAEFEAQHEEVLRGVELTRMDEPPFTPLELSPNHYLNGSPAALARAAISPG